MLKRKSIRGKTRGFSLRQFYFPGSTIHSGRAMRNLKLLFNVGRITVLPSISALNVLVDSSSLLKEMMRKGGNFRSGHRDPTSILTGLTQLMGTTSISHFLSWINNAPSTVAGSMVDGTP